MLLHTTPNRGPDPRSVGLAQGACLIVSAQHQGCLVGTTCSSAPGPTSPWTSSNTACQRSHGYMGCLVACHRAVCGRGSDREIVSQAALICPNHELILFDSSSVCFPDPTASTGGVSSPFAHTASADSLSSSI